MNDPTPTTAGEWIVIDSHTSLRVSDICAVTRGNGAREIMAHLRSGEQILVDGKYFAEQTGKLMTAQEAFAIISIAAAKNKKDEN